MFDAIKSDTPSVESRSLAVSPRAAHTRQLTLPFALAHQKRLLWRRVGESQSDSGEFHRASRRIVPRPGNSVSYVSPLARIEQLYKKFRGSEPPAELGRDRDYAVDLIPKLFVVARSLPFQL